MTLGMKYLKMEINILCLQGLLKVSKKINSKRFEVINITQAVLDDFESQLEIVLVHY